MSSRTPGAVGSRRSTCLQRCPTRVVRTCAATADTVSSVKKELLSLLSNTQRGVSTSPADRKAIMDAVAELKAAHEGRNTTGPDSSGTWELLWTTEKVRVVHTAKQGIPVRHVSLPAKAVVQVRPVPRIKQPLVGTS